MTVQQERHQAIARSSDEWGNMVEFSTQLGSPARAASVREKENQGTCGHYGKSDHEIKACYQITRLLSIQNGGEKALEVPKKGQVHGWEGGPLDVA